MNVAELAQLVNDAIEQSREDGEPATLTVDDSDQMAATALLRARASYVANGYDATYAIGMRRLRVAEYYGPDGDDWTVALEVTS